MKKILFILVALCVPVASCAWTIGWSHVQYYTDNVAITDDNVVYNLYIDNVKVTTTTDNTYSFSAPRGKEREYKVNAQLVRQGTMSDNTSMMWSAPTGRPANVGPFRFW